MLRTSLCDAKYLDLVGPGKSLKTGYLNLTGFTFRELNGKAYGRGHECLMLQDRTLTSTVPVSAVECQNPLYRSLIPSARCCRIYTGGRVLHPI